MGSFTIKLCDGFKMVLTNPIQYVETEDWQVIREALHLDVKSEEWGEITRQVFATGQVEFTMMNLYGEKRQGTIEVIPCAD